MSMAAKSHGAAWPLAILAVLVLYVGTWPFIEDRYAFDPPQLVMDQGRAIPPTVFAPPWINATYRPLQWLRDAPMKPNPLKQYWQWCLRLRYSSETPTTKHE